MNLSLAVLGFLVIVVGAGIGFYLVSILGVFILVAAFLVPSKQPPPKPQPAPTSAGRVPPRPQPPVKAPTMPQQQASAMPQPQQTVMPKPVETIFPTSSYQEAASSTALFPVTIFPSMNLLSPAPVMKEQKEERELKEVKRELERIETRDETLELATLVVLLRLLSG